MSKKIITLILAVAMVLALAACGTTATTTAATTKAATTAGSTAAGTTAAGTSAAATTKAAAGEFILGTSQPLSGTNAQVGDACLKGIKLAIKQINAKGGFNGQQVRLVSYDDQSSPEEGAKIANKLIEIDKVNAVAGSLISSVMLGSGGFFNEAKLPVVGSGLAPTWMQKGWEWVYRACANNDVNMPLLAQSMYDMGVRNVAIFAGQDDASKSGGDVMQKALEKLGVKITTRETYVEGDTDFSGQVAKIINSKPDAVFNSTYSPTQPVIAKQLRQFGYKGMVYCKETLSIDNMAVAGDSANYFAFCFPYVTYKTVEDCDVPLIKKFLGEFKAEYNEMPYHDCAYRGYDAVMVLYQGSVIAKSNKPADLKAGIDKISGYEGLGGTFDYTKGDREGLHAYKKYVIVDGKYQDLDGWIKAGGYDKFKASLTK